MRHDLTSVLRWLTGVLTDLDVPYQVVGGLAAMAYGSTRPLVDIDLYVPDAAALAKLAARSQRHLVRPPERHRDEYWDLSFLKLIWGGWEIEAADAATASVWDGRTQDWRPAAVRFELSDVREVAGVALPVMPRDQLLDYKLGLGRQVDRIDVHALEDAERMPSPRDSV